MGEGKVGNHKLGMNSRNHKLLDPYNNQHQQNIQEISAQSSFLKNSDSINPTEPTPSTELGLTRVKIPRAVQDIRPGQEIKVLGMDMKEQWQRAEDIWAKRKGSVSRVTVEEREGEFQCPLDASPTWCRSMEDLKKHILKKVLSQPESRRSCIFCGKRLSGGITNVKTHLYRHLPASIPCKFPGCVVTKRTEADMKHHMESHQPKQETEDSEEKATKEVRPKCNICGKDFSGNSQLVTHIENIHNSKYAKCPSQIKKEGLQKHRDWNCPKRSSILMLECEVCGVEVLASNYANHRRNQHRVKSMLQQFAVKSGVLELPNGPSSVDGITQHTLTPALPATTTLSNVSGLGANPNVRIPIFPAMDSTTSESGFDSKPTAPLSPAIDSSINQRKDCIAFWAKLFENKKN